MSERDPFSEIEFVHGIPGLRGASGKFHPITTDMGVEVSGSENEGATVEQITIEVPKGMQGESGVVATFPGFGAFSEIRVVIDSTGYQSTEGITEGGIKEIRSLGQMVRHLREED